MCPPCKIILDDGGVVVAAANAYAEMGRAAAQAITAGITHGRLSPEQIDEAHAFSELQCHRAALIRAWTEELRLHTTKIIGGEYDGGYIVDGVDGIRKKE